MCARIMLTLARFRHPSSPTGASESPLQNIQVSEKITLAQLVASIVGMVSILGAFGTCFKQSERHVLKVLPHAGFDARTTPACAACGRPACVPVSTGGSSGSSAGSTSSSNDGSETDSLAAKLDTQLPAVAAAASTIAGIADSAKPQVQLQPQRTLVAGSSSSGQLLLRRHGNEHGAGIEGSALLAAVSPTESDPGPKAVEVEGLSRAPMPVPAAPAHSCPSAAAAAVTVTAQIARAETQAATVAATVAAAPAAAAAASTGTPLRQALLPPEGPATSPSHTCSTLAVADPEAVRLTVTATAMPSP